MTILELSSINPQGPAHRVALYGAGTGPWHCLLLTLGIAGWLGRTESIIQGGGEGGSGLAILEDRCSLIYGFISLAVLSTPVHMVHRRMALTSVGKEGEKEVSGCRGPVGSNVAEMHQSISQVYAT